MPLLRTIPLASSATACCWLCREEEEAMLPQLRLPPGDEAIYHSITHKNRKMQWLGCRLALASLLPARPITIRYDVHGKPALSGWPGHISLSHSGSFAAAILSPRYPVGIDVELVRDKIERIASRFLSHEELAFLPASDRLGLLTICWSAKEAVYKIFGTPEIDLRSDIVIEPFEYLCSPSGTLTARVNLPGAILPVQVSWYRLETAVLACAILTEDQAS